MENTSKNSTIGIFKTHADAENAIKALQKSGFKMDKLSIVGKDYHTEEEVIGYYNTGDRMKAWGAQGAFWGGVWGLMFSSAFFVIPGIGPLLFAGPIVATIVSGLEGAAIAGGLGVLGGGLFSLGIPKNSIIDYETAIKTGQFLLIAHGNFQEMESARQILKDSKPLGEIQSYLNNVATSDYGARARF